MKFIYVDESGARDQGDVFVMCGLMVDAYKLRKKTEDFDRRLETVFANHEGNRPDFKTSRFINGKGGWSAVDATERKAFLKGRVASITGQARSTLTRENGQPTDSNLAQPSSVILLRARTPICASVF